VAVQLLPTSILKVHLFVLNSDGDIESAIFNAIWVCFLLHGVPMKRSVFHCRWESDGGWSKALFDLNDPSTILSGQYNSSPPDGIAQTCREYKEGVVEFMKKEWRH
jgi:hypothetical protein